MHWSGLAHRCRSANQGTGSPGVEAMSTRRRMHMRGIANGRLHVGNVGLTGWWRGQSEVGYAVAFRLGPRERFGVPH
jgi:hypothetical protein